MYEKKHLLMKYLTLSIVFMLAACSQANANQASSETAMSFTTVATHPTITHTPVPDPTHSAIINNIGDYSHGIWKTYTNANYIKQVFMDKGGNIWTAGRGGVVCWNEQTGTYEKFTAVNGLAGNFASAIAQTKDGSLWFGTFGMGLSRFDGKSWKTFTTIDGLPSNTIISLASTPNGGLWILSKFIDGRQQGGLAYYEGNKIVVINEPATFEVMAIAPDGTLWAGGNRLAGLYHLVGDEWKYVHLKDNVDINITAIAFAPTGEIWVATWSDILIYDGQTWQNVTPWHDTRVGWVKAIAITSEGAAWVGLARSQPFVEEPEEAFRPYGKYEGEPFVGLYRYEKGKWTSFTSKDGMADNEVTSIGIGGDGSVWFGSYRYGLSRYKQQSWSVFQTNDKLLAADIHDMDVANGKEGPLILLSHDEGISFYDSKQWRTFSAYGELDLYSPYTFSVNVNADESFWVSTHGGLAYFDGSSWVVYSAQKNKALSAVYYISDTWDGKFYIYTSDFGVLEFSNGQWQKVNQLDNQSVRAVRRTKDGTIFFSTLEGVFSSTNNIWKHYTSINGLLEDEVYGLDISPDGRVWASTCKGLSYLQGDRWLTATLSTENTGCFQNLAIDQGGSVWINTPRGLFYFNGQNSGLVAFPGITGSATLNSQQIKIDSEGTIWISTNSGLFEYMH